MMKLLYITFGSGEEALSVCRQLLAEGLVACANVRPDGISIYNWQGETRQEKETVVFAKTSEEKAKDVIARVKQLHSYEVPCILSLPVEDGFQPFMDWVEKG